VRRGAFLRRHRERAHAARLALRIALQQRREQHLDLAADHVVQRGSAAFVGHVDQLDAGERAQQRARQVTQAAQT
jgi:hypothetical protein